MRNPKSIPKRLDKAQSHFIRICILHLAFWITGSQALATVLLPADFGTVVTGSQTIAHGRVISVQSAVTGPVRRIESVITLAVMDAIKGPASATISFRVPNGQIGRYRRIVVGAPEFAEGDEVVVFLQGRAPAIPSLFGLSQGVYRVTRDGTARPMVSRPVIAVSDARVVRGDPARQPVSLEAFTRGIQEILEQAR